MATSYLIVTKWRGSETTHNHDPEVIKLIKQVNAQGAKARTLAAKYALVLNNGIDYSIPTGQANLVNAIKQDLEWYTVCAIPTNQAQEFHSYETFENCEVFKEA